MQALKQEIDDLDKQLSNLKKENEVLNNKLNGQDKKAKDLEQDLNKVKNGQLAEQANRIKALEKERDQLKKDLEAETISLQKRNDELVNEATQLRLAQDETNYENEKLKSQIEELGKEIKNIKEGNIKQMAENLKEAESQRDAAQRLAHDHEAKAKNLESQISKLNSQNQNHEALKNRVKAVEQKLKVSSLDEIAALVDSKEKQVIEAHTASKSKVSDLESQIQKLSEENKKLKQ